MPLDVLISNAAVKSRNSKSVLTDDYGKVSPAGTSHYSCGARSWACQIVRLSESDTPCQRLCRPGTTGLPLLSWMLPTPTFWRAGLLDQGPPNCPTYPPPYLTQTAPCQGRMGANKQDDMWEESQIRMQERDLPKCNQATFTLCISTLYAARDVL